MNNDTAILFSGGTDSLCLYAMAALGDHDSVPKTDSIHLLYMINGMSRFPDFPRNRYRMAKTLLDSQAAGNGNAQHHQMKELDMGRLFQGLWLDVYEDLMPEYNGKNLVCVACKLAMHARAILYCLEHDVGTVMAGYTKKQSYYPEQTPVFMDRIDTLSSVFSIRTVFPVYNDFDDETVTRHYLEDRGLPSTGGGERKCLFSQTKTTATEKEIGAYLDDMIPSVRKYIQARIDGNVKKAASYFPPGRGKE